MYKTPYPGKPEQPGQKGLDAPIQLPPEPPPQPESANPTKEARLKSAGACFGWAVIVLVFVPCLLSVLVAIKYLWRWLLA